MPTTKIKVTCACGEEVTEKDIVNKRGLLEETIFKLMSALQSGYYDDAGKLLLSLFEEDRPAEPEKKIRAKVMTVQCYQCSKCKVDGSEFLMCRNATCSCHS
jgi:hypothetical protein